MKDNSLTFNFSVFRKQALGIIVLIAACCFSCEDILREEMMVYNNDFSKADLANFENGKLFIFEGDTVLGYYHDDEVRLRLDNLPAHNTIKITLEILLHDSWDGNPDNVGGPDYWYLKLDDQSIVRTTFSNSLCESTFCLYQSYPDNYPRFNDPKTGALRTDLPGRCQYINVEGWTSLYRITKLINHTDGQLSIAIGDELKQENTPEPVCDESWSVASIQVSTLTIN